MLDCIILLDATLLTFTRLYISIYVSIQVVVNEVIKKTFFLQDFKYIPNNERQIYAAMVSSLDDSIGKVTEALKKKKIYDNTIIVFATDNGGAPNGMER